MIKNLSKKQIGAYIAQEMLVQKGNVKKKQIILKYSENLGKLKSSLKKVWWSIRIKNSNFITTRIS